MDIKHQIADQIKRIVSEEYGVEIEPKVDIPVDRKFGDYTTNVAMQITKIVKKSSLDIAKNISEKFKLNIVENVNVVSPGFINFELSKKEFTKIVFDKYLSENFYSRPLSNLSQKVLVEHTSVNPNKAMHVGHLRNVFLGDSISRLLKRYGYKVEVENYIDDTGLQVADTTAAVMYLGKQFDPSEQEFDDYAWDIYTEINKKFDTDPELAEKRKGVLKGIEEKGSDINKKAEDVVEKILECHLSQLADMGIEYDLLVYESDIIHSDLWDVVFEKLKKSPNFILETEGKNKGCWVLKYSGDGGDKIFVRSDGTKVYTAKDTAHHMWKYGLVKSNFSFIRKIIPNVNYEIWRSAVNTEDHDEFGHVDKVVNVIDERQSYPQEMVKLALKQLGYEKQSENYEHIAYGVVSLSRNTANQLGIDTSDNAQSYAMSGRKGIGIKSKDLLKLLITKIKEEKLQDKDHIDAHSIALAALKFYMLKNHPKSSVLLDLDEALNIEGYTGPYLQYSYARAKKILTKGGQSAEFNDVNFEITEHEYALIQKIAEWEDLLNEVSNSLSISYITEYLYQIASLFSTFYQNQSVLKAESEDQKNFRLKLVQLFVNVLEDGLKILGIPVIEEM